MSKQVRSHLLQFGSEVILYNRTQNNSVSGAATGDAQGILTFTNAHGANGGTGNVFANFLIQKGGAGLTAPDAGGYIQTFQQDSRQADYRLRYAIAEPYFQDDWRVNRRLTLNSGVRLLCGANYRFYSPRMLEPRDRDPRVASASNSEKLLS